MVRRGLELLELRGATDLSLREVARLAGVSQTAPTHHFGDKEGLLAAIASEGFRKLMAERLGALKDGLTKEERLRVVMRAYVSFALRHPELFHLMFGPRIADKRKHAELMDASVASFQFLSHTIAEFLADQVDQERPPRFSAIAVWSGMHGLATLLTDRESGFCQVPDELVEDVCQTVSSVLLGGLLAPHASAAGKAVPKKARRRTAKQDKI